jgi:hypothetical protein
MNKTILTTAVVSAVTGGVLGGIVTYAAVNKTLRTRYEDWANSEIDSVKQRYALMRKGDGDLSILDMAQNPSPEVQAAVDKGKRIIAQMGYSGLDAAEEKIDAAVKKDVQGETSSIFDHPEVIDLNKEEDDEEEPSEEDILGGYVKIEGEPFKITEADYFENEPGFSLDTLTYYEVDDTLCDENNAQIDRVDETIGERHLHMFHKDAKGNGKNSIYIRNDEHQTLYEVILVNNSYAAIVLGMDEVELGIKAPKERPRRMRDGD